MKTFKTPLLGVLLLLVSGLAFGHGNHIDEEPAISRADAVTRSEMIVRTLVQEKKLARSWQQGKLKEAAQKVTQGGSLWIVSFDNPAEKDKAKQTIHILLDDIGNYIGANHTGKY
jgi:hypothetical protein